MAQYYGLELCVDMTKMFEQDTGHTFVSGFKLYMCGIDKYFWVEEKTGDQSLFDFNVWTIYHAAKYKKEYGE